jgi:hypothetical protein
MSRSGVKLNESTSIHVLASDLGLRLSSNPVGDIVGLCHRKVETSDRGGADPSQHHHILGTHHTYNEGLENQES